MCRDRVLLSPNLISCCSFILMLQHGLLVLSVFAVATQFVMSRPDFFSLCWNICRDIEKSVVTGLYYVQVIYVARPKNPCRDIEISLQLEICRNIGLFCCHHVSSLSKHHLSQPCLSVATRVSSFSVVTYITLSRQRYLFEALLISQQAFSCCNILSSCSVLIKSRQ